MQPLLIEWTMVQNRYVLVDIVKPNCIEIYLSNVHIAEVKFNLNELLRERNYTCLTYSLKSLENTGMKCVLVCPLTSRL